jgi:hypothetical protein
VHSHLNHVDINASAKLDKWHTVIKPNAASGDAGKVIALGETIDLLDLAID